jgi:hypothetical protein
MTAMELRRQGRRGGGDKPWVGAALFLFGVAWLRADDGSTIEGYRRDIPPESAAARAVRLEKLAARRAGPAVIVHRGASAWAPENTLEAYAAAMDLGADGCEVDVRRTADGVLVLFHDDMLDQLTDGFGTVRQLTYLELLRLQPRWIYGTATQTTRPPTFAALLMLARARAMLLHLDVKEPDLEEDLERLLDAADAWDHVVAVNQETAPRLAKHPRVKLLRYKAPGLYEGRIDMDPEPVRAALAKPGEMLMVDDPRVASRELRRPPYEPVPIPSAVRMEWTGPPGSSDKSEAREDELLSLLEREDGGRSEPGTAPEEERRRAGRILERAQAAAKLAGLGKKSDRIVRALELQVRYRSLHTDWMFHGLDGALAARALGELGATESVPCLVEAFRRIDPALARVADPRWKANPLAWTDFRTKMYILPALGDLPCPAAKGFLLEYLALDEKTARELAPPLQPEATRALCRQALSRAEIESLLRHSLPAVRGTALLVCLDEPTPDREAALEAAAPWARQLPRRPVPRR